MKRSSLPAKGSPLHCLPRWLPFIVWGGIVFWLSLIPSPPVPKTGILSWDKFQHAVAYGLLTIFAFNWYASLSPLWRRLLLAAVTAVMFGALMEMAQGMFTTSRSAEMGDLLADAVGAAAACAVTVAARHLYKS